MATSPARMGALLTAAHLHVAKGANVARAVLAPGHTSAFHQRRQCGRARCLARPSVKRQARQRVSVYVPDCNTASSSMHAAAPLPAAHDGSALCRADQQAPRGAAAVRTRNGAHDASLVPAAHPQQVWQQLGQHRYIGAGVVLGLPRGQADAKAATERALLVVGAAGHAVPCQRQRVQQPAWRGSAWACVTVRRGWVPPSALRMRPPQRTLRLHCNRRVAHAQRAQHTRVLQAQAWKPVCSLPAHLHSRGTSIPRRDHSEMSMPASKRALCATMSGGCAARSAAPAPPPAAA